MKKAYLLILLIISACSNTNNVPSEIKKHFNDNQIEGLNNIVDFFSEEALNNNQENFKDSFKEELLSKYLEEIDTVLKNIDYKKQKQSYSSGFSSVFDEIWEIKTDSDKELKGQKYMLPNINGQFLKYLNDLKTSNELAQFCYKATIESGDYRFLPFYFYVSDNYNEIDLDDFNNKLIISIFYLSGNDDNKRNPIKQPEPNFIQKSE